MDHSIKAGELFLSGCNCAQAVFLAFTDVTGLDTKTAAKISSSFGGGMGCMREVWRRQRYPRIPSAQGYAGC